jgi:alkanesulfonate monooxygenase SsuD/methylene tetrahydromethanopterin reductase-like flavin-dependent oxidoreductase (luciferase family)
MMLSAGGRPDTLRKVLTSPDWPRRPMALVKGARIIVRESHEAAIDEAQREYAQLKQVSPQLAPPTVEDFLAREIVGTPHECLDRIEEIASWGVNYLRVNFPSEAAQDRVARLILPQLVEREALAV